ncbi:MAG: sulfotransferase [Pseudomonadota bacterium]
MTAETAPEAGSTAEAPSGARQFHFISGLPRSGSTLLAALLRQNPRFHAGMSSPVAGLFEGVIAQVSAGSEMASMVSETQRARILRGLFDSFYADHGEAVVFDTNRSWTAQLPALMSLFPEARVICCVRNVAWVMDSMERQFRAHAFENTRLFNSPGERSTVYTRTEALAGANRLVGFGWHALREACYSEFAERLVLVDYDLLVSRPGEVMGLLYDFVGQPRFEHDFESVDYDAPEFDAQLGLTGLHRVDRRVEPRSRQTVLPPDLFRKYDNLAFWRDMPDSRAFRIVVQPPQGAEAPATSMPGATEPIGADDGADRDAEGSESDRVSGLASDRASQG